MSLSLLSSSLGKVKQRGWGVGEDSREAKVESLALWTIAFPSLFLSLAPSLPCHPVSSYSL